MNGTQSLASSGVDSEILLPTLLQTRVGGVKQESDSLLHVSGDREQVGAYQVRANSTDTERLQKEQGYYRNQETTGFPSQPAGEDAREVHLSRLP